jgi:hypothetical protein
LSRFAASEAGAFRLVSSIRFSSFWFMRAATARCRANTFGASPGSACRSNSSRRGA